MTCDTWAMPWLSRRITPICEGVRPFFASLVTWSVTSAGDVLDISQLGGVRLARGAGRARLGQLALEQTQAVARGGLGGALGLELSVEARRPRRGLTQLVARGAEGLVEGARTLGGLLGPRVELGDPLAGLPELLVETGGATALFAEGDPSARQLLLELEEARRRGHVDRPTSFLHGAEKAAQRGVGLLTPVHDFADS